MSYKQVIVVRRDLCMSPGKLAEQVSKASSAWLSRRVQSNAVRSDAEHFTSTISFNYDLFYAWMTDSLTSVIVEVKNLNQLNKCLSEASDFGLVANRDFFPIEDKSLLESGNEVESLVTCVGFAPFPSEAIDLITKKYPLYR